MNLATAIVNARDKSRLTLQEVGDRVGVSRQAVWAWESGVRAPSLANVAKLTQHLPLRVQIEYGKVVAR